ncbi:MAG: hypothetical protein J0H69_19565 [Burkholderiales bacterium]|nr:hypothetical protein [Burkholderiales bacterium]
MTLEELRARLAAYLEAETKILAAQEYVVGQGSTARRLTRADLGEVRAEIQRLSAQISQLEAATQRARRTVYLRPFG